MCIYYVNVYKYMHICIFYIYIYVFTRIYYVLMHLYVCMNIDMSICNYMCYIILHCLLYMFYVFS